MIVSDPRQAAMFGHPMRSRILLWCAAEERSLSQMRARFGLSLSKLHYHVGQLLGAGLMGVSRIEPRGGRPIRYYRAAAETFRVPHELLPAGPSERWAAELRQSLNDATNRAEGMTANFSANAEGELMVRMQPPATGSGPPRVKELWRVLPLDAGQREALAKDMAELLNRYAQPAPRAGTELYWLHIAFAPKRSRDA